MIKKIGKKLVEEEKLEIGSSDPIKIYVEDSMQLLIHNHIDKERGKV